MRRLSFKLPVVLRYSLAVPFLMFVMHKIFSKNRNLLKYYSMIMPIMFLGLSFDEILNGQRILFGGQAAESIVEK
jgi:hypothetical protein